MFGLRNSLRNFENNVRISFLAVKNDIEGLNKTISLNKKQIEENKSHIDIFKKSLGNFKDGDSGN